ncbi:MAG: sugar ABC transporter permease [Lachnospiraceae bacterium]|nr:sugar ABC transporter permease [Lachnospiraceae bacterium]
MAEGVKDAAKKRKRSYTLKLMKRNWLLYLFLLPSVLYVLVFNYLPMYGIQIAFKNFTFVKGYAGSEWVGFKWFIKFFESIQFKKLMVNTLRISIYSLVVGFPIPIIFALVMNNIRNLKWKKVVQTITYMPHFISTVVLVGMMSIFLSPTGGLINRLLELVGGPGNIHFLGKASYFPHVYVWSGIWQGIGWGSIIYVAALAGVDQELHEAAMIDGANKLQRVYHIDIPSILPTIIIMLILRCGSIMSVGYEKAYLLQNNLNLETSEVINTYVYKMGLLNKKYSYSAAIGQFNNIINFVLLMTVNKISRKVSETSLW